MGMGWEEGDPRKDGVGGRPVAGRLPMSASIAPRGHGARPGHLPGPLYTEAQARPRGKPGPGAVAARLQGLASRGPGAAAAAEGRPHPGTRVCPAQEPADPEAAGGARAQPLACPGPPGALCASAGSRPAPPAPVATPGTVRSGVGGALRLSRGPPRSPLILHSSSSSCVPSTCARVAGAHRCAVPRCQAQATPAAGTRRSGPQQVTGGLRVRPHQLQGYFSASRVQWESKGLQTTK